MHMLQQESEVLLYLQVRVWITWWTIWANNLLNLCTVLMLSSIEKYAKHLEWNIYSVAGFILKRPGLHWLFHFMHT